MVESKSKRIKLSKADKYVETQEAFGWELVEKEDLRPDNTILLTMARDSANYHNFNKIKSLEKQYHRVSRPMPIACIVNAVIGLAFLIVFFITKSSFAFAYGFMYLALTFFCIAVYAAIVFLILFFKKGKLQVALKRQAATKSGSNKDWPTPRNCLPEDDNTWLLSKSID